MTLPGTLPEGLTGHHEFRDEGEEREIERAASREDLGEHDAIQDLAHDSLVLRWSVAF
jgi:hypothetical protein